MYQLTVLIVVHVKISQKIQIINPCSVFVSELHLKLKKHPSYFEGQIYREPATIILKARLRKKQQKNPAAFILKATYLVLKLLLF